MENTNVIDAICDALENITMTVRTRKAKDNQATKSEVFKYPNADSSIWYKYEQISCEHRFDCETIRHDPNAFNLLVSGVVSTIVIDVQKKTRMLSVDAFEKMLNNSNGIEVDVLDALKKSVKEVKPETVRNLTNKLPREQQIALANEQMKALGLELGDDGTLVPKQ